MTNSHNDLFVVRRCSQVQKQRSGRSLLRRHGIETTVPDDRKMRKHDENDEHDSFLFTGLVFISLLLHIFGEPTPIGFNGNSAAGSLGGGSLSAPSFSQELLEPCVSILDVFEFLAVDDAICSGLRELGSSGFDVCEVITSFAMEQHGKVVNTKLQEQDHLQRLAVLSCSQLSLRFQL